MRKLTADMAERLARPIQTKAGGSDPSVQFRVSRPTTPLTEKTFLERQTVLTPVTPSITDVSIAVCHPHFGSDNTAIYIGYISNGTGRITRAASIAKMASHYWSAGDFYEEGTSAISVAFDGTMPKNSHGEVEFITELTPWIFWVKSGALYAKKLGSAEVTTLALENCTDVSAVRAMWSEVGGFDFGLVVFFLLSGVLYYRQLINGVWTDATVVSYGPTGLTWTNVAAFRTWDYRVGVQLKDSTGAVYEMFTQFMGIGKQNVEHISIDKIQVVGASTQVVYSNFKEEEHINVASITASGTRIWGLTSSPVSARNVDDGTGNKGMLISVTLDYPVTGVSGNAAAFKMVDTSTMNLTGQSISVSTDGLTLTIGFLDFNNAEGNITLSYTPGTIQSPATAMTAWSISFTPEGLVPVVIPAPEIVEAMNI